MRDRPRLLPAVATLTAAATMALMGYEMARSAASSIFLAHNSASRLTEALMLVPPVMIALTLAISLLNPHVYLDTVVLIGSVAGQYGGGLRLWFATGAGVAWRR